MVHVGPFDLDAGHITALSGAIGVAFLTFARHMPPPVKGARWLGALFDSVQDWCKNNDRIGERETAPSTDEAIHDKLSEGANGDNH